LVIRRPRIGAGVPLRRTRRDARRAIWRFNGFGPEA
jgi:hypothetical protein